MSSLEEINKTIADLEKEKERLISAGISKAEANLQTSIEVIKKQILEIEKICDLYGMEAYLGDLFDCYGAGGLYYSKKQWKSSSSDC